MTTHNRPVVVGYDGSPAAEKAAVWAAAEAVRLHTTLRLVHALALPIVSTPMAFVVPPLETEHLRSAAQKLLREAAGRLEAGRPDLQVTIRVEFDGAAQLLLQEATAAQLVVLGSRGLGEFRDLLAGAVSAHVATHATCPVVVIPPHWSPEEAAGVVVGVDGSELSVDAIDFAFAQAEASGATLTAVMAWHDPVSIGPGDQLSLVYDPEVLRQESAALLAEAVAGQLEKYPDVVFRPELVRGHPSDVLIDAGRSAELLVVGTRGRGAFRGLLLGSTSRALVHHAPCPIAVVR